MSSARAIRLTLGGLVWIGAFALIVGAYREVRASLARPTEVLQLRVPTADLAVGDRVYLQESSGLSRVGEVAKVEGDLVSLAISVEAMARLTQSTTATVWVTPLGARANVDAVLAPDIQKRIADQVMADWSQRDGTLLAIWQPIAAELAASYWSLIQNDLGASFERHKDELQQILEDDAKAIAEQWPAIQARISPILHEHVTPVLSRLMSEALKDAPKVNIMWLLARGKSSDAFQATLNWLSDYLAEIPEEDRQELADACRKAWTVAQEDEALMQMLRQAGATFVEDPRLHDVFMRLLRESVTQNPRTTQFLREKVLESPHIRSQLHTLVDAVAPTARRILTLCLFDEHGATRPEIVHLLRSAALERKMAWVTLHTPGNPPARLTPNDVLNAKIGGTP